ncbi:hypothetical protein XENTR_v10021629 [Xenopus tropicalis]|nr:protein Z-dependent protease inhibitor [Xenopus tropicalis]XP_012824918.1 protein Z-dependent protease inhibitor [Xenopus tropicalis]KAE8586324.1 hypothetical protein XENTR_v10021629 [Xenopus tropicalis]|eukprot:XP_012824917.1 PREDICTED: protein Z-dependent protease inhibitor [Xenopus tropicalis]
MKRTLWLLLLLLIGLCIADHATKQQKPSRKQKVDHSECSKQTSAATLMNSSLPSGNEEQIPTVLSFANVSQMSSDFGFNLYRKIANKHDNNIFFSPFSVSLGLSSLLLGTRGNTYDQLLHGLNYNPFKDQENPYLLPELLKTIKEKIAKNEELVLNIGSLSFLHETFSMKDEFVNLTKKYFDMEYELIDFHSSKAKNEINAYVEKLTKGLISNFYDFIDPQTKLLLLDYIFFKGKWQYPFNPALTEVDSFFIDKYNSVTVPMMYKTDKVASVFDKDLSCTVFKLPYRGNAHMLIIKPEKEGDFGILEDHLTKELINSWQAKMQSRKTDIFFPKFKLDQKYKLKSSLNELGIKELFTGKANLTDLTEERNLMLTEITQQAMIEVDERGTEAAAVAGAEIIAYSLPLTIRVNRPFLFMIFEEAYQSLLFLGRVMDPTKL